jgi:hypothetical protein
MQPLAHHTWWRCGFVQTTPSRDSARSVADSDGLPPRLAARGGFIQTLLRMFHS